MQKKLHFKGVWFLPEDKENQISGSLDFSTSSGPDLQLFGIFPKEKSLSPDIPVICGITSDGKKITLYKCLQYYRGFNSNGLEDSSFEALYMIVGLLLPRDELRFAYINIDFQDYDRWLRIYGFRKNDYHKKEKEAIVEYKQPTDLSFSINDKIQCEFKFSTYAPSIKSISKLTIK